jgi:anti-sigma regulatory factor (Ser/Thr protein kinase)
MDYRLTLEPDTAEISRLLDWVETCCGDSGVTGDVVFKLALVLEEAVANVIHHAFSDIPEPHRIAVELAIESDRITALVIDNGQPFDPSTAPGADTSLPLEERDPGGLGIRLMRRMMDQVAYQRVAGENRLRLEKMRE